MFNLFPASRLYPKAMPHVSHPVDCRAERILPDRQMLLLDLCVIKRLLTKDKPSISECHRLPAYTFEIGHVKNLPFVYVFMFMCKSNNIYSQKSAVFFMFFIQLGFLLVSLLLFHLFFRAAYRNPSM